MNHERFLRLTRNLQEWSLKKKAIYAVLLGVLGSAAFPPLYLFPVVFITIPGLFLLMESSPNTKQAFIIGWWFGLGHFVSNMYWIAFSLGVDLKTFWWLIPFTVLGLPACFAVFIGLATGAARAVNLLLPGKILVFAALWCFFEWVRGTLFFTGFPWNLIGYSWLGSLEILQSTAYIGIYGLGLLTIVWSLSSLCIVQKNLTEKVFGIVAIASVFSVWSLGSLRLNETPNEVVQGVRLRLVQPNIPQIEKWKNDRVEWNFRKLLDLSTQNSFGDITHIIWPESALHFYLETHHRKRMRMAEVIPEKGALLVGGLKTSSLPPAKAWNSLMVLSHHGEILTSYDKSHLVPFGEYIPLRKYLPSFIKKLTPGELDFSSGGEIDTLSVEGLPPFSPLICYEGIFSGDVVNKAKERPEWLLNISNDGWFGPTSGPYQHFAISKVRSIEEGLPLIRVANTGISGAIDPYGRIIARLNLDVAGFLDVNLPAALKIPTFFSIYGNKIFFAMLLFAVFLAFMLQRGLQKSNVKARQSIPHIVE